MPSACQGLALLFTCVLPAFGCSRVLGFERAELEPGRALPSATPNSGAFDAGLPSQTIVPSQQETHQHMPEQDAEALSNTRLDSGTRPSAEPSDGDAGAADRDAASRGDAQAPDSAPPALSLDCATFCEVVNDACSSSETRSYAVYDSTFTCLRQCEAYDIGTAGDDSGNTLACRMTHALIARDFPGERSNSCPAAGPGGNGVCGSNCEGYCNLMQRTCDVFASGEQCLEECTEVPDLGGFDVSQNEGNSLQCRLYHLGAALASPTFHCPHASGQSPCDQSLTLPLP